MLTKKYAAQGLKTWVIMISNAMGQTPTKADCKVFKAQQNLSSRILYDPTLVTQIYGNKETFMITNEGAQLVYKKLKNDIPAMEQAIIQELSTGRSVR